MQLTSTPHETLSPQKPNHACCSSLVQVVTEVFMLMMLVVQDNQIVKVKYITITAKFHACSCAWIQQWSTL